MIDATGRVVPLLVGHAVHVLDVDDAADVVEVGADHREARVPGGDRSLGQRRHHVVDADRLHRAARHERVGGVLLAEADRPGEQRERLGLEGALLARRADEELELLERADRGELLLRLDAEAAHRPVGGAVQEPDERAEHAG